jgi:hypothetical protein
MFVVTDCVRNVTGCIFRVTEEYRGGRLLINTMEEETYNTMEQETDNTKEQETDNTVKEETDNTMEQETDNTIHFLHITISNTNQTAFSFTIHTAVLDRSLPSCLTHKHNGDGST